MIEGQESKESVTLAGSKIWDPRSGFFVIVLKKTFYFSYVGYLDSTRPLWVVALPLFISCFICLHKSFCILFSTLSFISTISFLQLLVGTLRQMKVSSLVSWCSKTCIRRPLLGPLKSGRLGQVFFF